jgi:hypothetical protein
MASNPVKRIGGPLAVLVVLVIVALLLTDPFGWLAPSGDVVDESKPESITLCDAAKDAITAFEIDKLDQAPFRLELEAGVWYAAREGKRYRANMERVDKLLEIVPGLKSNGLASDKTEKYATFEVDDGQAITFKVYTGNASPAAHLLIGKATQSYDGTFVRLDGQDAVYRAAGNIKALVGFAFRDFRTKEPWQFEPTTVQSISVRGMEGEGEKAAFNYDGPELTFTRETGLWQHDGTNANQNLLTDLVDKLSKLRVTDFVDEPVDEETGLAGLEPHVVVTGPEGTLSMTVGMGEEARYPVADQDGTVYQLSEYSLKPYLELEFSQLTFDDTAGNEGLSSEMEPDEGLAISLPSDVDE